MTLSQNVTMMNNAVYFNIVMLGATMVNIIEFSAVMLNATRFSAVLLNVSALILYRILSQVASGDDNLVLI
jgi:hypothetical protein